jgi:3'(2'), 5'-bisphosphate nucleotidase
MTHRSIDLLDRVLDIAREAGRIVMKHYGNCGPIVCKDGGSPVTAADREAHALIGRELASCTPGIPLVSEEGTVPAFNERRGWTRFWLVDPLDGTKEFISGNGEFTVNIALIRNGYPELGVVDAPALACRYFAARGRGAFKQDESGRVRRIHAVPPPSACTRVVESRSHASPELEQFLATLGPVRRTRLGSSLKFCRIAEGHADLYPRFGPTMEWDVAAGDCVFRHATRDGSERPSPLQYNQETLVTSRFVIGARAARATIPEGV